MAVIKSSKIFISIRHPHATCIINAQRKDTATFFLFLTTTPTHTYTFPSAYSPSSLQPDAACAEADPRNGAADEPLGAPLHREVRGVARLNSGTSFSHLHSRCVGLLSHRPNSLWECFCCWRNSILSLCRLLRAVPSSLCRGCAAARRLRRSCLYFSTPLGLSIPRNACEQFVSRLRRGLMSPVGGGIHKHRLKVNLQT